jgi:hypothetical protein
MTTTPPPTAADAAPSLTVVPAPAAGPAPEQAIHDIGTGQVVVDRAAGVVQVAYTGTGPFRITHALRDVFRAIFDRADEAEKVIADVASTGVDAAETAAAAATGNVAGAVADGEKTVVEGEQVAHDVSIEVHDVGAEAAALDAGQAVPAETGAPVNASPVPTFATVPADQLAEFQAFQAWKQSQVPAAPAASPLASLGGTSASTAPGGA